MNPRRRKLPSRETLRRVDGARASDLDVAGVDVTLHLIRTADIIRSEIYTHLFEESGLSEGKFSLLMTLRAHSQPMTVRELAESLGVADPTISIMIKRMLGEADPLIRRIANPADKRSILITLTETGNALIDAALPKHLTEIARFSAPLNSVERDTLVSLLKKLITPLPALTTEAGEEKAPTTTDAAAEAADPALERRPRTLRAPLPA